VLIQISTGTADPFAKKWLGFYKARAASQPASWLNSPSHCGNPMRKVSSPRKAAVRRRNQVQQLTNERSYGLVNMDNQFGRGVLAFRSSAGFRDHGHLRGIEEE
jgi:hypothetical protein